LTWEQFLRHQQQLDDNRTFRPEDRPGAVREGAALLQGLVLGGQCGRRMRVRYLEDGTIPSYDCKALQVRQAGPTCQSLRGDGVDAAVARVFLDAMQPAQLAISLATLEQVEAQARQSERQWHLRLERAQYEADLARRRFLAGDPENRLVARTLERDWNEKRAAPATRERAQAALPPWTARLGAPADSERAALLNQAGATPGLGGTFTAAKVAGIRSAYTILSGCPEAPGACRAGQRGDGRYSAQAAAQLLHVDVSTIADWCCTGRLE